MTINLNDCVDGKETLESVLDRANKPTRKRVKLTGYYDSSFYYFWGIKKSSNPIYISAQQLGEMIDYYEDKIEEKKYHLKIHKEDRTEEETELLEDLIFDFEHYLDQLLICCEAYKLEIQ